VDCQGRRYWLGEGSLVQVQLGSHRNLTSSLHPSSPTSLFPVQHTASLLGLQYKLFGSGHLLLSSRPHIMSEFIGLVEVVHQAGALTDTHCAELAYRSSPRATSGMSQFIEHVGARAY
jgi:hypothetical protein